MAGSSKWFIYTADDGTNFALYSDESNTEAVNGGTQDFLSDSSTRYALPRNVKPRYALYQNAARTRSIKCIALTQTIYNGIPDNVATIDDPIDGGTLTLRRIRPEILTLPFGADTGLTDGDAT
jgi:hypothetical protein